MAEDSCRFLSLSVILPSSVTRTRLQIYDGYSKYPSFLQTEDICGTASPGLTRGDPGCDSRRHRRRRSLRWPLETRVNVGERLRSGGALRCR
jgi:hypothetical protein